MSESRNAFMALTVSTVAFTVCFACWVLNAVLVTYLVGVPVLRTLIWAVSIAGMGMIAVAIAT